MSHVLYTLNSFSINSLGGNPAAVMIDDIGLASEEMQKIAQKINFSETAFLRKVSPDDYRVRFFTPNKEIELCGHATIAAFTLLREKGSVAPGTVRQKTLAGTLSILIEKNFVFMQQRLPVFDTAPPAEELAACLNLSASDIDAKLPVQIVSTGLRDILVPVRCLNKLLQLKPDLEAIKKLSKRCNIVGIHAFCLDSLHGATAHCRNFAPLYGIPEESATGTSNGALACYLYKNSAAVPAGCISNFEQGYVLDAPSEIHVKLSEADGQIRQVLVGGQAFITGMINISV